MPPSLRIEVHIEDDQWALAGQIDQGDRDGSMSDNPPEGGRDIYRFGVDPVSNTGYVVREGFGADRDVSGVREVSSLGTVIVASLHHGESHELTVRPDNSSAPRRIRFTYSSED
jgi:hypothetical protein